MSLPLVNAVIMIGIVQKCSRSCYIHSTCSKLKKTQRFLATYTYNNQQFIEPYNYVPWCVQISVQSACVEKVKKKFRIMHPKGFYTSTPTLQHVYLGSYKYSYIEPTAGKDSQCLHGKHNYSYSQKNPAIVNRDGGMLQYKMCIISLKCGVY